MMKSTGEDWYKKIWTLDIVNQSWVEDTKRQVDFIVEKLHLNGVRIWTAFNRTGKARFFGNGCGHY